MSLTIWEVSLLRHFSAHRYLFSLTAIDTLKLPEYKGSTLRGGFGHAFRKVVCTFKNKQCDDCLLRHRCVYSYVFETPPPADTVIMTKYLRAPHPFVIEPSPEKKELYHPGEGLEFGLVLIGRADDYLPYFIYAFDEMGKTGIGRGKGKYRLDTVSLGSETLYDGTTGVLKSSAEAGKRGSAEGKKCESAEARKCGGSEEFESLPAFSASSLPRRLTFRFLTPTRLVSNGSLEPDPDFKTIFRTLLRRLSMLSYFHCGKELEADYNGLIERAGSVETVRKRLRWHDWERYSARQDTRMKMGGFVGEMEFSGEFGEFLPFLELGELVHVGKGTGFGLGRYEIRGS
jgi:CRISPR-associated endoribonuclease Cas6